jgi:hypothetical protein
MAANQGFSRITISDKNRGFYTLGARALGVQGAGPSLVENSRWPAY